MCNVRNLVVAGDPNGLLLSVNWSANTNLPSSVMFDNKMVTDQYRGFASQLMLWKILSLTN